MNRVERREGVVGLVFSRQTWELLLFKPHSENTGKREAEPNGEKISIAGKLDAVCGLKETAETALQALRREMDEELNISPQEYIRLITLHQMVVIAQERPVDGQIMETLIHATVCMVFLTEQRIKMLANKGEIVRYQWQSLARDINQLSESVRPAVIAAFRNSLQDIRTLFYATT